MATKWPRSSVQVHLSGPGGCVKAGFTVPPCTHGLIVRQAAASLSYMSYSLSVNQQFQAKHFKYHLRRNGSIAQKAAQKAHKEKNKEMHRACVVNPVTSMAHSNNFTGHFPRISCIIRTRNYAVQG